MFAVLARQQAGKTRGRLAELQSRYDELLAEQETYRRVLTVIGAPATRAVTLGAPDTPQLHAYWHDELGLVLAADNLPPPEAGRTFQLWIIPKEGNPISVSIFRPDASGKALLIADTATPIAAADALAISNEPAGGSPQPTTTPIWVGSLS